MKSINAKRVYGLSATPKRSDGLERIIYMHCGPVRHKVDPKEQAAEQGFRRILQPRFTRIRIASLEPGASFNQVVDSLCGHAARNALIAEDAVDAVKSGRTPLVITNRKQHADELARLLSESDIETHVLTGEGTARKNIRETWLRNRRNRPGAGAWRPYRNYELLAGRFHRRSVARQQKRRRFRAVRKPHVRGEDSS